ncbi:hypothetical protein LX64_00256 [Chitinophaga skermanii]|uniref:Uncharacterized protein n=1 Tax=Chitinophaga skermanii TaxID=331697 RepID=A0A327R1Y1_9BACT|nr:hypothetical protein [Chitinophaga skermanii]RAJ10651.1 hypothetical protein LX64_00256 [Chitinophaga skermanii]
MNKQDTLKLKQEVERRVKTLDELLTELYGKSGSSKREKIELEYQQFKKEQPKESNKFNHQ